MTRTKAAVWTAGIIIVNVLVDQITKLWAISNLRLGEMHSYFWDLLRFQYIENRGAFFGLGADWPLFLKYPLLIVLPIAFCIFGIYYNLFKTKDWVRIVLIATIIGGGIGNIIDRLFNSFSVIDFLNFGIGPVFRTGILNVADMYVTFGAILLIIYDYWQERQKTTE
jgi:signal peptidase II